MIRLILAGNQIIGFEGLSATEIYTKMVKVLKASAPSFRTVHRWVFEFKRDRISIEDDLRTGIPKTATTPKIIEQVHNMVNENPSLTKREIAHTIGISDERVLHILYEELRMKKLFGKLVPHTLKIHGKLKS